MPGGIEDEGKKLRRENWQSSKDRKKDTARYTQSAD